MSDPTVLANQRRKDEETIQALAGAGSDVTKPHGIEHHFVCANPRAAEPVLAWGRAHGYVPSDVAEERYDGQAYAYFDLVKSTVLDIERVTADTSALLQLAAQHGMEYDGWGCPVVE